MEIIKYFNQITDWADTFTIWIANFKLKLIIFNWQNSKTGRKNKI